MQSDNIDLLAAALCKAQSAMKAATYNKINPHFKSKYADLASVLDAVRKPLADNGLSITQTPELRACADGSDRFVLVTVMRHTSGQWVSAVYPLPENATPQAIGSALTYARRYSISSIACIAADEDDDANAAMPSGKTISDEQLYEINELLKETKSNTMDFLKYLNIDRVADLPAFKFDMAKQLLEKKKKKQLDDVHN